MSDIPETAAQPAAICWQTQPCPKPLEGSPALPADCSFAAGGLAGRLDLHRPFQGVELSEAGSTATVLAVRLPPTAASFVDGWVRGRDAVAIHEPADSRRLRVVSQWGLQQDAAAVAVDLVLSAQTAATCSDGALAVDSSFAAAGAVIGVTEGEQIDWLEPPTGPAGIALRWQTLPATAVACLLFRGAVGASSLAVLVRRDEVRQLFVRSDTTGSGQPARFAVTAWLFPTLIEKGVLHRSRLQVAVTAASVDLEWAAAAAFRRSREPPLLQ